MPSTIYIIGEKTKIKAAEIFIKTQALFFGDFLASLFGIDIPKITKKIQNNNRTIKIEMLVDIDIGSKADKNVLIPEVNDLIKNHPKKIPDKTFIIYIQ